MSTEFTEAELLSIEMMVEGELDRNMRDEGEFFSFVLLNELLKKVRANLEVPEMKLAHCAVGADKIVEPVEVAQ